MLVVGGGPAGSTTASRLAEAGASVRLVDKARVPRDIPHLGSDAALLKGGGGRIRTSVG